VYCRPKELPDALKPDARGSQSSSTRLQPGDQPEGSSDDCPF